MGKAMNFRIFLLEYFTGQVDNILICQNQFFIGDTSDDIHSPDRIPIGHMTFIRRRLNVDATS